MLFLGIDQHARQLTVSLRDQQGDVLLARQVSTRPARILQFFQHLTQRCAEPLYLPQLEILSIFYPDQMSLLPLQISEIIRDEASSPDLVILIDFGIVWLSYFGSQITFVVQEGFRHECSGNGTVGIFKSQRRTKVGDAIPGEQKLSHCGS